MALNLDYLISLSKKLQRFEIEAEDFAEAVCEHLRGGVTPSTTPPVDSLAEPPVVS